MVTNGMRNTKDKEDTPQCGFKADEQTWYRSRGGVSGGVLIRALSRDASRLRTEEASRVPKEEKAVSTREHTAARASSAPRPPRSTRTGPLAAVLRGSLSLREPEPEPPLLKQQ